MRNLSPITRDDDLITQKYAKDNLVFLYAKNIGGDVSIDIERILGGNLLSGTLDFTGNWHRVDGWNKADEYQGQTVIKKGGNWACPYTLYPVKQGKTYTFSLNAKIEGPATNECFAYMTVGHTDVTPRVFNFVDVTNDWKRFYFTFTADKDCEVSCRLEKRPEPGTLCLSGFRLDEGEVHMPYYPRLKDLI